MKRDERERLKTAVEHSQDANLLYDSRKEILELLSDLEEEQARVADLTRAALDRQSPFDDQIVFTADAALERYALGNRRGFTETHEELPDAKTDPVRLGLGDSELPDSPDSP